MLANCAPESLQEYLHSHVTALRTRADPEKEKDISSSIKMTVLSDDYEYESSNSKDSSDSRTFSPRQFRNEYLAKKNLILIYQNDQIVLGMSTFEYAFAPMVLEQKIKFWSRSYIQYVDSTGLYTPRSSQSHLTKSLVTGYLSYCSDVLHVKSVHLLATAKPSFLFAGSDLIEGKRALSPVKLINWWISILQIQTMKGVDCDNKVFVYSPFEEAEGSSRLKKRISSIKNWNYGLPYDLRRASVDQVPLFEDDPKWRHFEATFLDSQKKSSKRTRLLTAAAAADEDDSKSSDSKVLSVKEFFESLQIRPEFRADPSAFFVIKFADKFVDRPSSNDDEDGSVSLSITQKSDLATFGLKMLETLTFESVSEAKKSSQKLLGWMKLMKVNLADVKEVEIETKECPVMDKENIPVVQVQSLQSLIKKKRIN